MPELFLRRIDANSVSRNNPFRSQLETDWCPCENMVRIYLNVIRILKRFAPVGRNIYIN